MSTVKKKYTREVLGPIVANATSIAQVLKQLGLVVAGGNYSSLKGAIRRLGLSTAHFLGKRSNQGAAHKGTPKLTAKDVFLLDRRQGQRETAKVLRRCLQEAGVPERCASCNQGPVWKGRSLTLHVEHRDGNYLNNTLANLCFLCPNCHSQTATYCGRNIGRSRTVA